MAPEASGQARRFAWGSISAAVMSPRRVIQPLSVADAAHLMAVAERHFGRWYPWVLCALRTGLRLGELLALQWGDLDFNGRSLMVQRNVVRGVLTSPKSHQRRRVDMTPQLRTALLAWRHVQRALAG
jgi:integrase